MKKRIIIPCITLLLVGGLGFIVYTARNNAQPATQPESVLPTLNTKNSNIPYDQFGITDVSAALEKQVRGLTYINEKQANAVYSLRYRPNSLTKDSLKSGASTIALLVDIPEAKRTFKVTIERGKDASYTTVTVRCPEQSELIYPAKNCTTE